MSHIPLLILLWTSSLAAQTFSAKVVAITDGDTIRVLRDRTEIRVRLHGIDAPEAQQAFYERARQFTSQLAFGKTVTIRVRDTDQYGRTVADVLLPDGRNLNHELVKAGFIFASFKSRWMLRRCPF